MADGAQLYRFENDKIDIEYLHVPYSSIADEDVHRFLKVKSRPTYASMPRILR